MLKATLPLTALLAFAGATCASGEGLPVKSDLVRKTCGGCHRVDSEQRMSRISYVRKTPEGWEETIQRMMRLHGLVLAPADARQIEQYLADSHGLTASEMEKIAYSLDYTDVAEQIPNDAVKNACTTCHSYAKLAGQRRTRQEWLNLKDFLLAMFPSLVYQHRFEDWPALCDKALPWLADTFPFETPEWKREHDQAAPKEGRWLATGHQLGRGDYVATIDYHATADGGFETDALRHFADGSTSDFKGRGLWFAGSAWRGAGRSDDVDRAREVFQLNAAGDVQHGRWFPYQHPELGAAEVRYRADSTARIMAVYPRALRRGSDVTLKIYGANLNASGLSLGEGITVSKMIAAAPDHIEVEAHIEPAAQIGKRDIQSAGASLKDALAIYEKVDYIRVEPEKTLARLGGARAVKRLIQFEAHAFSNGPDAVPGTADDIDLGMVKAEWSLEESQGSPADEDVKFVGSIDQNGLFTPAQDGPNPARPRSTNNAGDVWVNVSYKPEGANVALQTRAYLLVSVPAFRELLTP